MFHNIFNIITIIEKANHHPIQKCIIVEMMLMITHGILVSKEILMSKLEQMGKIRGQLIKKRDEIFEAHRPSRNRS
jgi:predicted nucleic-acid-binding protein